MTYNYTFHEKAQLDYEESLLYYLGGGKKAGEVFIDAIDASIKLICEHPKRWRNIYKNFHEINVRKYPFLIIYVIDEEEEMIIITAVYHHKRNPQNKYLALK